jgi:hypothetical protein
MSSEGHRSILDDVLPQYDSILAAPSLSKLLAEAVSRGLDLEEVLKEERQKRYKAVDTSTGSIYLIQNPACWQSSTTGYVRPKPEYQCTLSDARKFGGGFSKKSGDAGGAF